MIKCTWIKDLIEDKQYQLKDQFNEENNLAIKIFFCITQEYTYIL